MPTDRGMDKEIVAHIHSGILLSHKKEHIWVSPDEVDEPRPCYIQSEVKSQKYIILGIYKTLTGISFSHL